MRGIPDTSERPIGMQNVMSLIPRPRGGGPARVMTGVTPGIRMASAERGAAQEPDSKSGASAAGGGL